MSQRKWIRAYSNRYLISVFISVSALCREGEIDLIIEIVFLKGEDSFMFSNKNPGKPRPSWKGAASYFTILLTFIVLLTSCASLEPVSPASTPTGQPQPAGMVAILSNVSKPGNGNTQISPKDNMVMVFIPAGEF